MSREVRYRTEIVIPKPQLAQGRVNVRDAVLPASACRRMLEDAAAQVAAERGGTVEDHYLDCNGQRHPCLLAVRTPGFPRGVGITVDHAGQVGFVFDTQPQGQQAAHDRQEADLVHRAVAQAYAARAVHQALRTCGFQTQDRGQGQLGQGQVLIQGVKTT